MQRLPSITMRQQILVHFAQNGPVVEINSSATAQGVTIVSQKHHVLECL